MLFFKGALKSNIIDKKRVAISKRRLWCGDGGAVPFPSLPVETPERPYRTAPTLKNRVGKTTCLDQRSANFFL